MTSRYKSREECLDKCLGLEEGKEGFVLPKFVAIYEWEQFDVLLTREGSDGLYFGSDETKAILQS